MPSISSLGTLLGAIKSISVLSDEVLFYRGHSNRLSFKLEPFVFREMEYKKTEESMLKELITYHPDEFASDSTALERLARAQHYSLPTRLLDVTWDPLVAAFFASTGHKDKSGEVIVFKVKRYKIKLFDSDTVSCLANLAYLKFPEKILLKKVIEKALSSNLEIPKFNSTYPVPRLLHSIKYEKSYFASQIKPRDLQRVVVVNPKQNNKRILAQSGAFLLFGLHDDLDTDPPQDFDIVTRLEIDSKDKNSIEEELDRLAVNKHTLFQDMENTAGYIKQKYKPNVTLGV